VSQTFERVVELIKRGQVRISDHGYHELAQDRILVRDILITVDNGILVEEYPEYRKGPCVLVL